MGCGKQPDFAAYGLTHSAFGLYGRFIVLLRRWNSHSLTRVNIQPLSWYTHPQGSLTSLISWFFGVSFCFSVIFYPLEDTEY
jgi:hypothetical protein